jgi:hypothetical protein
VSAGPNRVRGILGASMAVALFAAAGCGNEDSGQPSGQPSQSPTASSQSPTPSPTPSLTPSTPPAPSSSTPTSKPSGTPSQDCPDTIATIRAATEKATWGKGAARSEVQPVGVTICQYDAAAAGQDYATVMTKRTGKASQNLLAMVNAGRVSPSAPRICTKEIGPTYVLRFVDNDRGVWSFTVEAFGCRRLVATSFEGRGKPTELPASRQATPELIRSLGQR